MKPIRIHPLAMAEIYYNRMHFKALSEVKYLLDCYRDSPNSETYRYWRDVLAFIQAKVPQPKAQPTPEDRSQAHAYY